MTALSVRGVHKSFGNTRVLEGVNLEVPDSCLMAILGPSGCGKTTLLRLIAGFARPDDGVISFGDRVVFDKSTFVASQHRRVGFVAQEGALFPHLDVSRNITFGLPRSQRNDSRRVSELLELVGLDGAKAKSYPHELSGGQQQRVALARALAPNPKLVVLDEPFASLDATLRESTGRAVMDALRATNATAILVTHDQNEALSLVDQVAVMGNGKVVQADSPQNIYRNPADLSTATFVGAAILVPAVVKDSVAQTPLGSLVVSGSSITGTATALIRPEQVELLEVVAGSRQTVARVTEVSYYGHDAAVRMQLVDSDLTITARVHGDQVPPLQSTVAFKINGPILTFPS